MSSSRRAEPLVLVGAGGFAREAVEVVHAINADRSRFELVGFVDDAPELQGSTILDLPVLGPVESVRDMTDVTVVVCAGSPRNYTVKRAIVARLDLALTRYATLVHPTAVVPRAAVLGPGTVVLAATVLTSAITIGCHVGIMPGCVFTHDNVVSDYATFGAGVRLAGGVHVGTGAYVGTGALVREGVSIGPWSLIGMGSVVLADVPAAEVWVGAPAARLRSAIGVPTENGE